MRHHRGTGPKNAVNSDNCLNEVRQHERNFSSRLNAQGRQCACESGDHVFQLPIGYNRPLENESRPIRKSGGSSGECFRYGDFIKIDGLRYFLTYSFCQIFSTKHLLGSNGIVSKKIEAPPDATRGITFGWRTGICSEKCIIFHLLCGINNKRDAIVTIYYAGSRGTLRMSISPQRTQRPQRRAKKMSLRGLRDLGGERFLIYLGKGPV